MSNISVLDRPNKSGIVSVDCPDGRFQHELDYYGASSPHSDEPLVLDLAPPLYYPSSESKAYDRSPYSNHGTIVGASWKRLPSGLWVLSFDGVSDKVTIANVASLQVTGDMTILAWVNLADTSDAIIVAKSYANEFEFWACRSGDELALYHGDGAYELGNSGGADISSHVGEWILAGVTRTADPKKVKFYLNGSYISDWDYTKDIASSVSSVVIGQRIGNNYVLGGDIALVRIYNRVLTALGIQNHFNREKHLFGV